MSISPGQMLNNRYRIVELLGQGGFGAVYKGWDTNLDGPVAIKESVETSPAAQKQFQVEAKLLFKLRHPNLPVVHDVFILPGQGMYLVMDFVEGEDLETKLREAGGPLPESRVLEWTSQVCDALIYLHSQSPPIIHRDIKPANIRITPQGKAMLVDFGIAKIFDPGLSTTVGAKAVTPGFSPQEQYGQGITDERTDIYALGATLYNLLTGRPPVESIQRSLGVQMPLPRSINPALSIETEQVILRAMELLPGDRILNTKEFKNRLQGYSFPEIVQPDFRAISPRQAISETPYSIPAKAPAKSMGRETIPKFLILIILGGIALVMCVGGFIALQIIPIIISDGSPTPIVATPFTILPDATQNPTDTIPPTDTSPPTDTPISSDTAPPPITETSVLPSETASDNLQVNSVDGASLIFIPAGEFMMGLTDAQIERIVASCSNCKASSFLPSQPVHAVYLDSYWIYQTEVTNRMYSQCVNAGFCNQPIKSGSKTRSTYFGDPTYDHYPVIFVDWYMANQYCQWAGGRLPTEAEWEKAARGNDQRLFPWGDQMPAPQLANIGLYVGDTTPVGSYPNGASPYGLLDMAGNVYEWVADWYSAEYYSISPANNPMGPSGPGTGKELRVVRGGNLYWEAVFAISAYHDNWEPSLTGNDVGFRCARSP